ncbi:excisionase [Rhodococcus sp. CUA-806]|nr:excisionase [Rhodococcus sp. CUA-806]
MGAQAQAIRSETFMPEDAEQLAPVLSFLKAHEMATGSSAQARYALVGVDEHDRIELPERVHAVLKRVVEAMLMGRAVTLAPQSMTLTTQQAADLLGVSRPTVVRLISDNQIAADRVGNRHRLQLDDVLAYKESRRARQYDALSETSVSVDAGEDPDLIREQLREARKAVAARRRPGTRA